MKLTANVIGATGLVGTQLVKQLLENKNFELVRIFVRRDSGIQHPKLEQQIVNYQDEKTWAHLLKGDVLFSALGTTLKQAGSKAKQYQIDFTLNLNFARQAKENGIKNYVLVSSIGANSASKVFYTRIKGELDDTASNIGFENLAILRPSSLTGARRETRITEQLTIPLANFLTRFIFKKYRPIADEIVASAMINAVLKPTNACTIWDNPEIFELAKEK